MVAISNYFATLGVKVDNKSLKDVDNFLAKIEKKLSSGTGKKGMSIVPKVDVAAFEKHLRQVLRGIGGKNSSALRVKVQVSEQGMRKSIDTMLSKKNFNIPVTATLSKASLAAIRQQLQTALVGVPIHVRMGTSGVSKRLQASGYSWSPNASGGGRANSRAPTTPHLAEWLGGRPGRSSLSAANRRYSDSIMSQGFFGPGGAPKTFTGFMGESVLGGLGRAGSSTMLGRGMGALGNTLGGARLGAVGLIGGAAVSMAGTAFKSIWSGLATVVTAPFKMIGGAVNAVTSGFYRLALAIAPLVAGFALVNRNVQEVKTRQIALNTTAGRFGSSAKVEGAWLMSMAQREGMDYGAMIDPFTSFLAATAPTLGIDRSRSVFEAFSQYGSTHGATKESSGRAFYALSQMGSKGTVMSEELNQQMSEAVGYSGMKGLFAEAYQLSLGRTGSAQAKGEKAITELADAMKKGAVKTAAILPYLEELMRRDAAPGLAEARFSSVAEQNRFRNQTAAGWKNFSEGGGEEGLAYFWRMMQKMGTWWESNGAKLGEYFRVLMIDLNTLRVGIMEFTQFAFTGEENDLVKFFREWGINLLSLREGVVGILHEIEAIFKGNNDTSWMQVLKVKLQNFSLSLREVMTQLQEMLQGVNWFMAGFQKWSEAPLWRKLTLTAFEGQGMMIEGAAKATWNAGQATYAGGEALADLLSRSTSRAASDYQLHGDNRGGYGAGQNPITLPPTSLPQMYTPGMQANMGQTISGKVDVNVKVEGNPDLASQLNTPQAQSIIRKATQDGITGMLTGSMPNAPKN